MTLNPAIRKYPDHTPLTLARPWLLRNVIILTTAGRSLQTALWWMAAWMWCAKSLLSPPTSPFYLPRQSVGALRGFLWRRLAGCRVSLRHGQGVPGRRRTCCICSSGWCFRRIINLHSQNAAGADRGRSSGIDKCCTVPMAPFTRFLASLRPLLRPGDSTLAPCYGT